MANGTIIDTYGKRTMTFNFNLRRAFTWTFILANTSGGIIGADSLRRYSLLVDIHNKKLVDNITQLKVSGILSQNSIYSIKTFNIKHSYANLLQDYSQVISPQKYQAESQHDTFYYIEIKGPTIHERPRRLTSDKLAVAWKEFEAMVKDGICRPSKSPWDSPLQLVRKKNQEWRVCGDYRKLNEITIADRYSIPYSHDLYFL